MNARPWRSSCATSECVEWAPAGPGVWEFRNKQDPDNLVSQFALSVAEIGQLAQAYLDGEFGPVKVSRL